MQKIIASSILLAGFNTPVFSQDNPTRLPDTVVTATRSEIAKNELATAATVFYTRRY
jgi:vitamin B12 transporter